MIYEAQSGHPGGSLSIADIGKSCKTTKFAKTFPEQHVNVGIAEQNAAAESDGPVYLRFTRDAIPVIYDENATFSVKIRKILGATHWSGSFGEYVVVPEKTVVHLGDDVSFEEGGVISKIYPIEEFTAAMEMADKRTEPVVKVMLKF